MSDWYQEFDDEPLHPFVTYSVDDLNNLPEPEWLVAGVVPQRSYGVTYGVPGVGKSFAMLDMLLCVATGLPWHGHATKQGPVTYFAGEGVQGIRRRVLAWLAAHPDVDRELVMDAFRVVPTVPSFASDRERERVVATVGKSAWVVFDTLARGMSAGSLDENKASDMGRTNFFAEKIRDDTGAAVWHVHHTGKAGDVERGSVALRGAADTMVLVQPDTVVGAFTFTVSKQKDAREAPVMRFVLEDVPGTNSAVPVKEDRVTGAAAFANAQAKYGVRVPTAAAPVQSWNAF